MRTSNGLRWLALLAVLIVPASHRVAPPALVGRCTSPDGSLADTPCIDDGDCPDGHTCSVTARRPGARSFAPRAPGRVDSPL